MHANPKRERKRYRKILKYGISGTAAINTDWFSIKCKVGIFKFWNSNSASSTFRLESMKIPSTRASKTEMNESESTNERMVWDVYHFLSFSKWSCWIVALILICWARRTRCYRNDCFTRKLCMHQHFCEGRRKKRRCGEPTGHCCLYFNRKLIDFFFTWSHSRLHMQTEFPHYCYFDCCCCCCCTQFQRIICILSMSCSDKGTKQQHSSCKLRRNDILKRWFENSQSTILSSVLSASDRERETKNEWKKKETYNPHAESQLKSDEANDLCFHLAFEMFT